LLFTRGMARPLRIHVPGVASHVMSRGNNKQDIFTDDTDYSRFLELLSKVCDRFHVRCLAYCLMRNHTHLLLRPEDKPVSRLMQHLNSTYCQWFNRRHQRVGHVLQGRFKGRLVDNDASMIRVLRYILRNPVAAGYVEDPGAWRWSSYRATVGLETRPAWLRVEELWQMFDADCGPPASEQVRLLTASPLDDLAPLTGLLVGSAQFAQRLDPQFEPHIAEENFIYAERFATRPRLATLLPSHLAGAALHAAVRVAYLRYAYTLREIGQLVGHPTSTIWSWVQRAQAQEEVDFNPADTLERRC
jgi:REP element-mobilizing transposase RayT